MRKLNLAILGATGLVGRTMIQVLEEHNIPIEKLYLFASANSINKEIIFQGKIKVVEELQEDIFEKYKIDVALFAVSNEISQKYVLLAKKSQVIVIDNSSAWRMDETVPLIAVGANEVDLHYHQGVIANPNCTTIQAVIPLKIIDQEYCITKIHYNTYQAVSGSGYPGLTALRLAEYGIQTNIYPKMIAYNCIPQIDEIIPNGSTKEEIKMIQETKKILRRPDIKIYATCVRVPVLYGHSVSVTIECKQPIDLTSLIQKCKGHPKLLIYEEGYPTALDVAGKDNIHIGRIRKEEDNSLTIWVVADNVRRGAATNAIEILEELWRKL